MSASPLGVHTGFSPCSATVYVAPVGGTGDTATDPFTSPHASQRPSGEKVAVMPRGPNLVLVVSAPSDRRYRSLVRQSENTNRCPSADTVIYEAFVRCKSVHRPVASD